MNVKTKRILRIHLGLAFAEVVCVGAFVVEVLRAVGGNTLSWAYVFEWPIFGAYAIYLWHRLLQDERRADDASLDAIPQPEVPGPNPALDAYNDYLRRVHANPDESPTS